MIAKATGISNRAVSSISLSRAPAGQLASSSRSQNCGLTPTRLCSSKAAATGCQRSRSAMAEFRCAREGREQAVKPFGGLVQRSFAVNENSCSRSEDCSLTRIIEPASYRGCETGDISFRNKQARLSMNDDLRNAGCSLGDHWQTGGLCLKICQSIGLAAARPHIDAGLPQII